MSAITIARSKDLSTYRVKGVRCDNNYAIVDSVISEQFDYRTTTERFHQWQFDGKRFGVHFATPADATNFANWIKIAQNPKMTSEASSEPTVVTEVPKSLQEIIDKIKKPSQETSSQPMPAEPSQVVLTKANPAQVNEDKDCITCKKNMQTMQKLSHFQGNHLPSFVEHPFKFTQIEERNHLIAFYTAQIQQLQKELNKSQADKDQAKEEFKVLLRSEQAQVDNLFYENCQFRQQLKGLKAQLADAETKVQQLQTRLSEREDSEFETDYSTDSDYTDSSEEESTDAYSDEDSMNDKNKDKAPLKNPISVDSDKGNVVTGESEEFSLQVACLKTL